MDLAAQAANHIHAPEIMAAVAGHPAPAAETEPSPHPDFEASKMASKLWWVHGAASWNFLINQARDVLRIAQAPGARLRDIAAGLGITERRAYSIVTGLADAGYVVKHIDGRRNRDQVQTHLPRPDRRTGNRSSAESWPS
jgi:hypothetical protein